MRLLISGSWVRAPRWASSFYRLQSKDFATGGNVFHKHFDPIRPQGVLFAIPLSRSTANLSCQFQYLLVFQVEPNLSEFLHDFLGIYCNPFLALWSKERMKRIEILFPSWIYTASSILDSIVVSIPACHAGDRGSIPRRGGSFCSAINLCYSCNERRWKRSWTSSCKPYSFTKIVLVQNSMFNDTLVNFLFVVYMTQIRMSLCSRIKD